MRKFDFKKDILPHLVAVAVFLALTVFFFQPVFFEGKTLSQSDILQWEGSAKELIDYRAETGEEGLWTNSIFGGMPAYLVDVKWGNQLIKGLHAVITFGLPHPVRIIFLCMLSFYIMLLCFKVRPYVAIMGAIAFAFSSYQIIGLDAGHNARISAISFIPMVLGAIHLCFTGNRWLGANLTTLALAMHMRVNHLQITYYLVFVVGLYGLVQLIYAYKDGTLKDFSQRLALLVVAALLAIGTFFGQFYTTYEFGKYSNRGQSELSQQSNEELNKDGLGKTYAFQYSNGFWDPMSLFIPNILGGNASFDIDSNIADELTKAGATQAQVLQRLPGLNGLSYWGQETATTYYAGAIMVFLFVVGILFAERKHVIWIIAVIVLGILLSYGRNLSSLNYFLFDYFPGYNKFRSVTFTIVLPVFGIALLGMLGLEKLLQTKLGKAERKKLLIALGSTAGLALLLVVFAGVFSFKGRAFDPNWPDWLKNGIIADRKAFLRADAFRTFLFIALFAVVYYFHSIGKLSNTIAYTLFILLVTIDVVGVAQRFMDDRRFQRTPAKQYFTEYPGDQYIKQNKLLGDRVIDLTSPIFYDARASYHHASINGYNGARIRRFQELLDQYLMMEYSLMKQTAQSGSNAFGNIPLMNMLNAKFAIANPADPRGILTNNQANGAAWFVDNIIQVNSPDEEFEQVANINTKTTALVDVSQNTLSSSESGGNGVITLSEYHPGYWKYESSNAQNGLAVFSEIHYPKGFQVTIDGEPAEMLRANYILRALEVPAGQHTIEFTFAPAIYKTGTVIMQICSILSLLLFLAAVYFAMKQSGSQPVPGKS
ncbi:MAG: YfhO family protein [Roseivirga sp.]